MGLAKSKMQFLVLPAQSGKTRKVEEQIKRAQLVIDTFGTSELNIFISANNRLLVHQTTSRLKKSLSAAEETVDVPVAVASTSAPPTAEEVSDAVIKGQIFSWTSGSKANNISPEALVLKLLTKEVQMVLMCAHPARLKYLQAVLTTLSVLPGFNSKVNIWIDEADYSINLWKKYPDVLALPCVQQVTLISATTDAVFKEFGSMRVIPFEVTYAPCYRRLIDCHQVECDIISDTTGDYVHAVLYKYLENDLVEPGKRAFIPGDYTKASHEEIVDTLTEWGFCVLILNGVRKEIVFPPSSGRPPIDLRAYLSVSGDQVPSEFNDTLACLYKDNGLAAYPFAVTGYLCVQRGVTFQCMPRAGRHNGFLFDYGIIPNIDDKSEAYQTMARIFGNIGDHPSYTKATIYSTSRTFRKVESQESAAVHLARIVREGGYEVVDRAILKQAEHGEEDMCWDMEVFESLTPEEVHYSLKMYGSKFGYRRAVEKEDAGGFVHSSLTDGLRVLSYNEVMHTIKTVKRTALVDPKNRDFGNVWSKTFICYLEPDCPETKVYITKAIKRIEPSAVPRPAAIRPLPVAAGGGGGKAYNPFDDE
jgi:hypothetical protein